jgi:hypothetical protein
MRIEGALQPKTGLRDRMFLSFDFRQTRCSGAFPGPSADSRALSGLLNQQEPVAGRACPGTTLSNPDPGPHCHSGYPPKSCCSPLSLLREGGAQVDGTQQPNADGLVYLRLLGVVIIQDSCEALSMRGDVGLVRAPPITTSTKMWRRPRSIVKVVMGGTFQSSKRDCARYQQPPRSSLHRSHRGLISARFPWAHLLMTQ